MVLELRSPKVLPRYSDTRRWSGFFLALWSWTIYRTFLNLSFLSTMGIMTVPTLDLQLNERKWEYAGKRLSALLCTKGSINTHSLSIIESRLKPQCPYSLPNVLPTRSHEMFNGTGCAKRPAYYSGLTQGEERRQQAPEVGAKTASARASFLAWWRDRWRLRIVSSASFRTYPAGNAPVSGQNGEPACG